MKDWNLQGRRISVMYCIFVTVYLLHVLHLPLTLAEGEVAHVSQIDPLHYETYCQHDFSLNCPVYGQASWECVKELTNCTNQNYPYHCVMNPDGKVFHVCAAAQICSKGTSPMYNSAKQEVSCETCLEGHYQPLNIWSNSTKGCLKKSVCDIDEHKIKCRVEPEEEYTEDTLCRCDARNNFILSSQMGVICVREDFADCYELKCQAGQERLLNYTCAPICEEGFQRYESDICMPKNTDIPMTSGVTEKASPTSTVSENSTKGKSSEAIDTNKILIAIIVIAVSTAIILLILVVVACWKWKPYKKCLMSINSSRSIRRQSSGDQTDEIEMRDLNEVTVEGPSQVPTVIPEQRTMNDDSDTNAGPVNISREERSNQGLSNSILIELAKDLIPENMKFFFRHLSVPDDELDEVEINYRNNVKEQRYQVLRRLNGKGRLNMPNIIQGFEKMERKDLVNKYREMSVEMESN